MLQWREDKDLVCSKIVETKSPLKIVLKTKDDPIFLKEWVKHHGDIVGRSGLIIFDNESTDTNVMEFYREVQDEILIVKYDVVHNDLHDTNKFPELYKSLRNSCDYYTFLDTDEFMTAVTSDGRINHLNMMSILADSTNDSTVLPGIWIYNSPGCRDVFHVGSNHQILINGLLWGKPTISSQIEASGFVNHNCQLEKRLFKGKLLSKIIIYHFAQLSAEQRIRTNINKLITRKVIHPKTTMEEILGKDTTKMTDVNIKLYFAEIQNLHKYGIPARASEALRSGEMRVHSDGILEYFSDLERSIFGDFIGIERDLVKQTLFGP